jgi:hypothetical protein
MLILLCDFLNWMRKWARMYRCYLTRGGQIASVEDLDVATLSEAITAGYTVLQRKPATDNLDGIEIWQDRSLLYKTRQI